MYSEEFKTIIFRLSLRKMDKPLQHLLLKVNVQYYDIKSSTIENVYKDIFVERKNFREIDEKPLPLSLDQNLNRYNAVKSILESIGLSNRLQFSEAQKVLNQCILEIRNSSSCNLNYCHHLIEDLEECKQGMQDVSSFQTGIHIAHSYATMYYMERSSGIEVKKYLDINPDLLMLNLDHYSYGYLTMYQKQLQDTFDTEKTESLLSNYLL